MVYDPVEGAKSPDDRRQYNKLYYVTLYDSTNKMAIAQDEVAVKENENKSCVRLLKMFSLSGSIVTADALNTQRSVAKAIIEQDGEYCLAVKDNHKKLLTRTSKEYSSFPCQPSAIRQKTQLTASHSRAVRRYTHLYPFL